MRFKPLLSFGLLALALPAAGMPAYPGIITVTNPDGTKQELRGYGDENFNFFTDADSDIIMERNAAGQWVPAQRQGRVLMNVERDRAVLYEEMMPSITAAEAARSNAGGPMRMATLDSDGRTTYPTTGNEEIHALVILLEYSDTPFSVPNPYELFNRMLNEEGFSDYGARGSARDYYMDSSNGLFNVHFDVAEIVPLKNERVYYSNNKQGSNGTRFGEAIKEAIEYLDERGMDFSQYDYDNDGIIDNIFFFYSGYGQADTADTSTIWPHQGSYYNYVYSQGMPEIIVDGKIMATYACSSELNGSVPPGGERPWLTGIGAFCHEYGHVLGLPDFYDISYSGLTVTPGRYSVMDQGSYNDYSRCPPRFSSYEQWCCNWLEYIDAEEGETYTLPTISGNREPQAVRVRVRRPSPQVRYYNECYIFETRTQTSWDTNFPEEGMFIWHINYSASDWINNTVNYMGKARVELIKSDSNHYAWPSQSLPNYSYPKSENFLEPWNKNQFSDIYLTNITYDRENESASFDYNAYTEQSLETELYYPKEWDDASREFVLEWTPVEGATGYLVTVVRKLESGAVRYVDNYNEKNVGNVTSVVVSNISASAWSQEFEAWVRPIDVLPSSVESNHIFFVPDSFAAVDGIVEDSAVIAGGQGCVIAPAEAEVYNVNGVRTGRDNLPKGLYIVVYGKRSEKVLVR